MVDHEQIVNSIINNIDLLISHRAREIISPKNGTVDNCSNYIVIIENDSKIAQLRRCKMAIRLATIQV